MTSMEDLPPKATILNVASNGDGTSVVTIGTANWGQGSVTVPDDALSDPATMALYVHAANLDATAYTAKRQSRRDQQRYGG